MTTGGRELYAGLHLLDRQLVDRDGRLCGNVDDVKLHVPEDGGLPIVSALLTGPGVLGRRTGGRIWGGLGRLHESVVRGLGGGPSRIPFTQVQDVGDHVVLSVARHDLDAQCTEEWVRVHVVAKIPGSDHAAG